MQEPVIRIRRWELIPNRDKYHRDKIPDRVVQYSENVFNPFSGRSIPSTNYVQGGKLCRKRGDVIARTNLRRLKSNE